MRLHKENLIKEMAPKPKQPAGPAMTLGNMRELGSASCRKVGLAGSLPLWDRTAEPRNASVSMARGDRGSRPPGLT